MMVSILALLQKTAGSSSPGLSVASFIAPAATIIAALFGGTAGAWIGAQLALNKFKRERAFDRRLDWHESMIKFLLDMAGKISIACTIEQDIQRGTEPQSRRPSLWIPVQLAHVELTQRALQGAMYATSGGVKLMDSTMHEVQKVADQTQAFYETVAYLYLGAIAPLITTLRQAAGELATEGRSHLGLE
jgi:surface antigen